MHWNRGLDKQFSNNLNKKKVFFFFTIKHHIKILVWRNNRSRRLYSTLHCKRVCHEHAHQSQRKHFKNNWMTVNRWINYTCWGGTTLKLLSQTTPSRHFPIAHGLVMQGSMSLMIKLLFNISQNEKCTSFAIRTVNGGEPRVTVEEASFSPHRQAKTETKCLKRQ